MGCHALLQGDLPDPAIEPGSPALQADSLEISSRKLEIFKETFHAKMGTIKNRDCMDLKEAEDIKKRWQECTELYKKKCS